MNKVEFEKWVDKMLTEYQKARWRFDVSINEYNGTVICGDSKTGKCGMARCHPNDEFNHRYGRAIAFARCRGYDVPKLTTYKKLSEMKYGDKFKKNIGFDCYLNYTFIGESTYLNQYILEEQPLGGAVIKEPRLLYFTYNNNEYEMVE